MSLLFALADLSAELKQQYRRFPAKDSTLDIDFVNNRQRAAGLYNTALNGVTFTRTTTGTYFDATGTMQTAAINTPRFDYDPILLRPLGLLIEESRANILLNSDTGATQSVTVSAVPYTLSFWGTGTVTLSGVSTAGPLAGTGTNNRVSLTFTPTAGALTLTVSGTVTKWQLEAGSFATSYIPTAGTAATRGADVVSMTGSSFSSWYGGGQEGTIAVSVELNPLSIGNQQIVQITDGTTTNRFVYYRSNGVAGVAVAFGASLSGAPWITGGARSASLGFQPGNTALAESGVITATTSATTSQTVSILRIGTNNGADGAFLNGYIRRLTYYPKRLPNNLLPYLSKPT